MLTKLTAINFSLIPPTGKTLKTKTMRVEIKKNFIKCKKHEMKGDKYIHHRSSM